jgi:hypothetical protein
MPALIPALVPTTLRALRPNAEPSQCADDAWQARRQGLASVKFGEADVQRQIEWVENQPPGVCFEQCAD